MDKIIEFFSPRLRAPHSLFLRSGDSVRYIQADMAIALAPILFWSAYVYSPSALLRVLVCATVCLAADALWSFAFAGDLFPLADLSSPICGVLLACYLSPRASLLHCVLISVACSLLFKGFLGAVARSPIHPVAGVAALFSCLSFFKGDVTFFYPFGGGEGASVPEMIVNESTHTLRWYDELFGNIPAPLGCASAILIIGGGLYLALRKIIDIRIPLAYVTGACVVAYLLSANANPFNDVLFVGICGQSLFTAFFICSDRMYAPRHKSFALPYGALCGAAAIFLCFKFSPTAAFPLSIVIGNLAARITDLLPIGQKPFGKM